MRYDQELDEFYPDELPDRNEHDEWFDDDCRERARDMREILR